MVAMGIERPVDWRRGATALAGTALALVGATALVAFLEGPARVPSASAAYLLAVFLAAAAFGTYAGIFAAVGSFVLYDFLFVEPYYTLTVDDPGEWLNLLLLLVGGIVVGQLTAAQRSRAQTAIAREREARALFSVSRALAIRSSTLEVLDEIAKILRDETAFERVWIGLSRSAGQERVASDTGAAGGPGASVAPPRPTATQARLRRMPGDTPAEWVIVHEASAGRLPGQVRREGSDVVAHRITIEAAGRTFGSIWGMRRRSAGTPDRTETRLLAASADQLGQALELDRLAAESRDAEIARESDRLKSALLESVSHDLRTPLASIRAAAGSLMDPDLEIDADERIESAGIIDAEAEHLNRLVTNLLDLSRIEAGSLRADLGAYDLEDLVATTLRRLKRRLGTRRIDVDVDGIPPVEVDPLFLDQILTNLIENAGKYTPADSLIRVIASGPGSGDLVRLTVEDAGPGVPDATLGRLFEKFYRVPGHSAGSRSGTGVGLAVVRGLTEAMGGSVAARRSELGGLAIDIDLRAAATEPPG